MKTSSDANSLVEPPEYLDGAKVIMWAWSGKKPFGFIPYDDGSAPPIEIFGLAICQYEKPPNILYLFSCDRDWEVQGDSPQDTAEHAQKEVPDQFKLVEARWIARPLL